jgi:hypothetical protein
MNMMFFIIFWGSDYLFVYLCIFYPVKVFWRMFFGKKYVLFQYKIGVLSKKKLPLFF